jgi:hypothetical protein
VNRPIAPAFGPRSGERSEFVARFRAWLSEPGRRAAIACAHLRGLASLAADRAKRSRETAEHARANPDVWRDGTAEIVARFERLAGEDERGVAGLEKLVARIEAEGLPPEVEAYDPTEPKP